MFNINVNKILIFIFNQIIDKILLMKFYLSVKYYYWRFYRQISSVT